MVRPFLVLLLAIVVVAPGWAGTQEASSPSRASAQDVRKLSVDLVWANIRAQYGKIWPLLHPRHQIVTTRAFWESCKRKEAAETRGVEWLSVRATDAYPDRLQLPPFSKPVNVTAVTITARVRYLGNTQTIADTNYWTKVGGKWRGLWRPEAYRAYVKRRCPPN